MKQIESTEALKQLFFNNKKIYVEHNANGINFTKELILGQNIAMTSDIPVTVLLHGKWYIIE